MRSIFINGIETQVPDIGETVSRSVHSKGHEYNVDKLTGKVIYVHPKFRFFVVLFGEGKNTYRESYIIGR